jgi:hypothetical protein
VILAAVLAVALPRPAPASAQPARSSPTLAANAAVLPSIEAKTTGMRKIDGFFPLYWHEAAGQLWMEVSRFGTEVLHSTGLATGLGSNDIGLDRGALTGSRIVFFERVGPKVLLVQPNYRFRANTTNPAEARTVRDAFARSVLWSFAVAAESGGRVLVDVTEFLVRDANNIAARLRPGTYRFEPARSSVFMTAAMGFPKNTEMEAELTFVLQASGRGPEGGPAPGPGLDFGGSGFLEGVAEVASTGEAASLRVHHSLVELPDGNYTPRRYDPRSGFIALEWEDRAAPLGEPLAQRVIRRHRLAKVDPRAKVSDPVKPIVYYLDPGAPEPVRSALLEGARWWNQGFEAAGYRDAFRVELLPEGAHPLDIRYNVINWVHRSTRGWSTGGSVVDPRTGEIIKGVVTLGSLRIRQDYLLAEGLLSPYRTGTETPPELAAWALARIRQLSAHEVGHTLGFSHNYYSSGAGRISVMDYPHPLVTLTPDGRLDYSQVYATGLGEWDTVGVVYGYQDFPAGTDEPRALQALLDQAWTRDLRFMTNQDMAVHPRVDWWSNGTDPAAELVRMMEVRRAALSRFGEQAIRRGTPMAQLEEALVPLYLHHRYQVEAAASVLGGQHYVYALRGDGREPVRPASAAEQQAALDALLTTLRPAELRVPDPVLRLIPPRPPGWEPTRELFPRHTGPVFDPIAPASVAARHTVSFLLDPQRAARLVAQHALDPSLPGLERVLDVLTAAVFEVRPAGPYEAEIARAVQRVVAEQIMELAALARHPQVRALASLRLQRIASALEAPLAAATDEATTAHATLLARDMRRFLDRPAPPALPVTAPPLPPGAPIGQPAMEWLDWAVPACEWRERR